jgi:transglutaminase-like putative cysteine protease
MSSKDALEHRTSYTFDRLVRAYPHIVRLRRAPHTRTPIEAYSLRIEPDEHFINWQQDAAGNFLARLVFPDPMRRLAVTFGLFADPKVINPFAGDASGPLELVRGLLGNFSVRRAPGILDLRRMRTVAQ